MLPRRLALVCTLALCGCAPPPTHSDEGALDVTQPELVLPRPTTQRGTLTLEEAIARRRSRRALAPTPLTPGQIGQLCWAAQGITGEDGRRAAPSSGGVHPIELHVVTPHGLHRYDPERHALRRAGTRDVRAALHAAAFGQDVIASAPVVLVFSGAHARTARRYGDRAPRYVAMEAGHAAQNALLQAEALGLAAVPIGAFDDDAVWRALGLDRKTSPLYLVPVGHPR